MTPPQKRVLNAIADLTSEGVSPTYRAVARKAGLGVGNVYRIVDILQADGLVMKMQGRARTLRVVGHFDPIAVASMSHADLLALRDLIDARLRGASALSVGQSGRLARLGADAGRLAA